MKAYEFLKSIGACNNALEWVGDRDLQTAWDECEHPDWMVWLLFRQSDQPGWLTRREATGLLRELLQPAVEHMPPASQEVMTDLRRWSQGEEVDLEAVRRKADAYAHAAAADVVYAASYAASAVDIATYTYAATEARDAYAARASTDDDTTAYAIYADTAYAYVNAIMVAKIRERFPKLPEV